MTETTTLLINLAFIALFGIIGFFLKRTIQTMYDHITSCNERHISAAVVQNEVKNLQRTMDTGFENMKEAISGLRHEMKQGDYRKAGR